MPPTQTEQQQRREHLFELLQSGVARTQQDLVTELETRGIRATQSSVSRDLRDLGAVKTSRGYTLPVRAEAGDLVMREVSGLIRKMQAAGPNLLVIRTGAGAAQRVALALDRSDWPEIVGNIGGDDTVFVATGTVGQQKKLLARLHQALGQ